MNVAAYKLVSTAGSAGGNRASSGYRVSRRQPWAGRGVRAAGVATAAVSDSPAGRQHKTDVRGVQLSKHESNWRLGGGVGTGDKTFVYPFCQDPLKSLNMG